MGAGLDPGAALSQWMSRMLFLAFGALGFVEGGSFLVFVLQLNCVNVSDVMMIARVVSYSRFIAILK